MGSVRGRSIGRYKAQCTPGFCVVDGGTGTSGVERDLFALLRQVFGRGEQPYDLGGGRAADMAFRLENGLTVVIEYDGAYWHAGHELRDLRKNDIIMARPGHRVVRLREDPLVPFDDCDLRVPKCADSTRCASLVFPHLGHLIYPDLREADLHHTVGTLAMVNYPEPDDITCDECRYFLDHVERYGRRRLNRRARDRAHRRHLSA